MQQMHDYKQTLVERSKYTAEFRKNVLLLQRQEKNSALINQWQSVTTYRLKNSEIHKDDKNND